MSDYVVGWICIDCMMLEANGEGPGDWTEEQHNAHLDKMNANSVGYTVTLGLPIEEHDDDCPSIIDGAWLGNGNCECEQMTFSWQQCALCRSSLGGSRDAVTFWPIDNDGSSDVESTPELLSDCYGAFIGKGVSK